MIVILRVMEQRWHSQDTGVCGVFTLGLAIHVGSILYTSDIKSDLILVNGRSCREQRKEGPSHRGYEYVQTPSRQAMPPLKGYW